MIKTEEQIDKEKQFNGYISKERLELDNATYLKQVSNDRDYSTHYAELKANRIKRG